MSLVKIDRTFPVSNVVLTPQSIRTLIGIMNRAEKRLPPPAKFHSTDYSYRATGSDGLRYSSETSAEFLEILDARQVSDIEMTYNDFSNHAHIDISFSQEASRYGSTISNNIRVAGTDSMWVRAVADEM